MFNTEDCRFLLDLLAQEIVVPSTGDFPYTITKRAFGYSNDPQRSRLQAKLSIMLEAAGRLEDSKKDTK